MCRQKFVERCSAKTGDILGSAYAEFDRYIRTGKIDDTDKKAIIDRRHKANLFKLAIMPIFDPKI